MKTFTRAILALRSLLRRWPAPTSALLRARRSVVFLTCLGVLCVERNGALLCCMPGAPVVRLPL